MTWMQTDLSLLTTDAAQLRQHLDWLLEDLHVHPAVPQADAIAELVGRVTTCLEHLAQLDALLVALRQVVG